MENVFLNVMHKQAATHTPIWLMRQAGRYLPEYRKLREQAGDFLTLCKTPELATEVSLQPLRRFNLDAAILFSDILVIPEAMGLSLYFSENEGPKFRRTISSSLDVDSLKIIEATEDLAFVLQTIKNLRQELPKHMPLIGFSGSPWTLACYMIEGGSSKNYEKIKGLMYNSPQLLHSLLEKLSFAIADYLSAQISAGVDTIMLFDSWGGVLNEANFINYSLFYLKRVLYLLGKQTKNVPSIVFTKGGGIWLEHLNQLPCTALGVDWTIELAKARTQSHKILQGNLDPVILSVADFATIKAEVRQLINNYQQANCGSLDGHIFNLGHGILPSAKPDNVACLIDTVHELTRR